MALVHNRLTATQVRSLPEGKHCDGAGLWLHKSSEHVGRWVLRVFVHGKRKEMGLGSIRHVSLKEAREASAEWHKVAASGKDPVRERRRCKREAERNSHRLADVTMDAFETRKADLKDDGRAGGWLSPLENHVLPKLGQVPIAEIDQIDIRDCLRPIWHTKADTAKKALNRISIVFRHAQALGLDVNAGAPDAAKALLGKSRHVPQPIASIPWQDVPAFYSALDEPSPAKLCLRLLILTGLRSNTVRNLRVEHVNEGEKVLTVPADLMKARKGKASNFRVPLSDEALRVIDLARRFDRDGHLFPGAKGGSLLADTTLVRLMDASGTEGRPHGFRASLRTWLAECTDAPHEVAEATLAHSTGSAVVRAYQRSDFLEQRRALMQRWAEHCVGGSGEVVRMVG